MTICSRVMMLHKYLPDVLPSARVCFLVLRSDATDLSPARSIAVQLTADCDRHAVEENLAPFLSLGGFLEEDLELAFL